jgi:hypothetical protein
MQLETRAPGGYWLVHIVVPYRVADPPSTLGTFSSFSIGDPVIHQRAECEHPLLGLLGPTQSHKRQVYLDPFSKILLLYAMVSAFGG